MDFEHLVYEKKGRIAVFTLNRPDVLNALNSDLRWELSQAYLDFDTDPELWVGILTGAGDRAFCAGMDVRDRLQGLTPEQEERILWMQQNNRDPQTNVPTTKPLIAAIHGHTIGAGLSITLLCDIIIAADNTRISIGEVKRGVPPTWVLVRSFQSLPYHVAMEMNLTGDPISAQDAHKWGMVNQVVPRDQLMEAAFQMADRILDAAPLAVRAAKSKAQLIHGIPLEQALQIDVGEVARKSEDAQEGLRAFAERRKPQWKAR